MQKLAFDNQAAPDTIDILAQRDGRDVCWFDNRWMPRHASIIAADKPRMWGGDVFIVDQK